MARKTIAKHNKKELIAEIDTLVMPLMSLMQRDFLESIRPFSINPGAAILLEHVANGVKHPKELAHLLETVPPVVSALIGELESKGLIERRIDPEDKRRVKLTLSKQGKQLHEKIRERSMTLGGERLSKLSTDELSSLIHIFHKLLEEAQAP
ncbi:MAG: MarR family winged helix-turn-helix transcriptional regulator [Trueperaceae bacterium]